MSNYACNFCQEPGCPPPEIQFISVIGALDLCNDSLDQHPSNTEEDLAKRFRVRTSTVDFQYDTTSESGGVEINNVGSRVQVYTTTYTNVEVPVEGGEPDEVEIECQVSFTSTHESSETTTQQSTTTAASSTLTVTQSTFSSTDSPSCDGTQTTTYTVTSDPPREEDGTTGPDTIPFGFGCLTNDYPITDDFVKTGNTYTLTGEDDLAEGTTGFQTTTITITYSGEVDASGFSFPDYPVWQGESENELETDQNYNSTAYRLSNSAQRIRYRIRHFPTPLCYLKVWVRKHTIILADPTADPPVEAGEETQDEAVYEWEGSGSPCLPDENKPLGHENNLITSDHTEIGVPILLSYETYSIIKYSCLRGYEPDITDEQNPQPSGFPDPNWEALPP